MAEFDLITNSEIATDADVDSLTFLKLLNRDTYLAEVLAGTHTDKIPAQAIETQASGSGAGLTTTHHNHIKTSSATLGVHNVAANGISYIDTTITKTLSRVLHFAVVPNEATGTAIYKYSLASLPGTNANWWIRVERLADNVTAHTLGWVAVAVAVS